MSREVKPSILIGAVVGLLIVVGLIAYFSLRSPGGSTTSNPQTDAEHAKMMKEPALQGKGKDEEK